MMPTLRSVALPDGCLYEKFRCHHWRQYWHYDNSEILMFYCFTVPTWNKAFLLLLLLLLSLLLWVVSARCTSSRVLRVVFHFGEKSPSRRTPFFMSWKVTQPTNVWGLLCWPVTWVTSSLVSATAQQRGNTVCQNIPGWIFPTLLFCRWVDTQGKRRIIRVMSPWRPLLGLLPWCVLLKSWKPCHGNSFEDWAHRTHWLLGNRNEILDM